MPKSPQRAKDPIALHNLTIRISGDQKNQILDAAFDSGYSVAQYVLYAIWTFMRSGQGIPSPGPSQFLKASKEDMLRAYLSGETLLMPCGKPKCDIKEVILNGLSFCGTCNVRIA
jgi:hypothetical protein